MSDLFIRRPIATTLVMLAILIFGIIAYRSLPANDLPNVDYPTITVQAALPGASPETMASSVATPLERQFSTIAGLDSMSSTNVQGLTSITLQFNLSRNIDAAAQDVQSSISAVLGQLPTDMPSPPIYQKVNPADSPILYMALSSPTLPLSSIDEYAETTMAERISMVSGVAQVQVYGAQKYAVRAQVDPLKLASRSIGIDEVQNAIRANNVNLPTGTLWGEHKAYTVQTAGQLTSAGAYRRLIVAYRNGSPVRLEELGRVIDSVELSKIAAWYDNERSVVLAVRRQPGTNTIEVVNSIMQMMPTFRHDIPASVQLTVLYDRSQSIRESVQDVKFTLLLTIFLVILVIFLFLRNVSATIIPSLALPLSILGTFAVMYELGYTIDNLSLLALTLSVGFVVDDAIVMLENIVRHMELGEKPLAAAYSGSREIGFTIISMTLSLAAVFIPFLFLGGIIGRLLHEFAITIAAAILVSGFVSLTLTPMLASRFLRAPSETQHGAVYRWSERGFDWMLRSYDASLRFVMRHKLATMGFTGVVLAASIYLFMVFPKGFLPSEDRGVLFGFTEAQQGISFDAMMKHEEEVRNVILKDPNVATLFTFAGYPAANSGIFFVHLKPRNQRKVTVDEMIDRLRPQLMTIPGILAFIQNPPPISVGSQFTKSLYQVTLQGPDTGQLYRVAPQLENELRSIPALTDVTSDLQILNPQVNVSIDRDKASALGVTAQQIEDALFSAYGERRVSTIYAPNNEYRVILELEPQYQGNPQAISLLYIRSSKGDLVPLSTVARLSETLGPLSVNHVGQLPAVTVSFNLKPGESLGPALALVNEKLRTTVPASISTNFLGAAEVFQNSQQGLTILLIIAVVVIYIVLGILYESFIHPLTILSGLPAAGFGALITLWLFKSDLNLYAFVGVIMLVGLVKKNAIMMIDFALTAERDEGKLPEEAIYQGCLVRFRPIMMTTMAALMGTLPIAMGIGAGADARRPLGLAVVGGLLFSQFLTLYITPVVYVYLDRFANRLSRNFGKRRREIAVLQPSQGEDRAALVGR